MPFKWKNVAKIYYRCLPFRFYYSKRTFGFQISSYYFLILKILWFIYIHRSYTEVKHVRLAGIEFPVKSIYCALCIRINGETCDGRFEAIIRTNCKFIWSGKVYIWVSLGISQFKAVVITSITFNITFMWTSQTNSLLKRLCNRLLLNGYMFYACTWITTYTWINYLVLLSTQIQC